MEDWTRVVLYGTYDGFVRSTVDSLQIAVRLDSGERVEIPSECVISADQIVKKDEIKLRDVIKRIKDLDIGAREVWLNEILNELGSDYGTLKYKDGYEQGKVEGLVEREKPVVKQFVADWYEDNKDDLEFNIWDWIKYTQEEEKNQNRQFTEWLGESENDPVETLVKMKLFGYTVEKEKRYTVKITKTGQYLYSRDNDFSFVTYVRPDDNPHNCHTRKDLEQAGFGEVFNSPLFEVEEVEG